MFTWQWGKVFAQEPRDTAGFITKHSEICETLLKGNACVQTQEPLNKFGSFYCFPSLYSSFILGFFFFIRQFVAERLGW